MDIWNLFGRGAPQFSNTMAGFMANPAGVVPPTPPPDFVTNSAGQTLGRVRGALAIVPEAAGAGAAGAGAAGAGAAGAGAAGAGAAAAAPGVLERVLGKVGLPTVGRMLGKAPAAAMKVGKFAGAPAYMASVGAAMADQIMSPQSVMNQAGQRLRDEFSKDLANKGVASALGNGALNFLGNMATAANVLYNPLADTRASVSPADALKIADARPANIAGSTAPRISMTLGLPKMAQSQPLPFDLAQVPKRDMDQILKAVTLASKPPIAAKDLAGRQYLTIQQANLARVLSNPKATAEQKLSAQQQYANSLRVFFAPQGIVPGMVLGNTE